MSSLTGSSAYDFYSAAGTSQPVAPRPIIAQRAPLDTDIGYPIGQTWVDQAGDGAYILLEVSAGAAAWEPIGGGLIAVDSLAADTGVAVPVAGTITLSGGTAISTSASGSTVTFNGIGGGFETTVVTADTAMAVNRAYITNKAGTSATMTLPVTAAVGDAIRISGLGATSYTIAQNAGQTIRMNATSSTTGAGGSAAPTSQYQTIELLCIVANTDWEITYTSDAVTIV